ncbi:MAG TPA: hypothetical protein VLK33_22455 [Terriglobales bacterium]|nr:hypothetical protein [Terriglobales bacterium]
MLDKAPIKFGVEMKNFMVSFAAGLLALSVSSFAQTQQSSSDKSATTEKSQTKKDASSTDTKAKANADAKPAHSVMDHPLAAKADVIVVPAGTEIRVDMVDGKVTVPVRVGFSTPIPALSKASVRVDRVYAPAVYDANGNLQNNTNARYAEYGVLTGITVSGTTYKVETDSVPLATPNSTAVSADNTMGNSPHDVKFVLSAPIEIPR